MKINYHYLFSDTFPQTERAPLQYMYYAMPIIIYMSTIKNRWKISEPLLFANTAWLLD